VVVVGLDGLDPRLIQPMLEQGVLPHLAAVARLGGWSRVETTTPAQTPVAWSTFATGVNPGGHGIFDFLRRDPATYLPDLGLNRYEAGGGLRGPRVVNLRRGVPFWHYLTEAGVPSAVIRCPCTYPPDAVKGRLLSGMGVPDLRGGFGCSTYYTERSGVKAGESEQVVQVTRAADGGIRTSLIGPRLPQGKGDSRVEMSLQADGERGRVVLRLEAGNPREITLEPGRWSEWVRVKFALGTFQSIRGMARFYLRRWEPELELIASPVNFDAESPVFPISSPPGYAAEILEAIGPYYTTGMVEEHAPLSNGRLDEAGFLAQCAEVWDEREAMLLHELGRLREGFLFCLFDTSDRAQHMLWRHREVDHPANSDRPAERELGQAILDQYRRADAVVGEVLKAVDSETLVIAMSDHGFGGFRRGVDLNGWLRENGYLATKHDLGPDEETAGLLQDIDWARTKAYALGLGGIYLNLKGREAEGIVASDEAEDLGRELSHRLAQLVDPRNGGAAIRSVRGRVEVYQGAFAADSPDLMVNFAEGYRVSWTTSQGGVSGGEVIVDNDRAWAGDHVVDPALVPGVLFMNRAFDGDSAGLRDLAPTILAALGIPAPGTLEGRSLLR
jgi:predicted AlkP superfamily phosphohydrolase/phosphomutase